MVRLEVGSSRELPLSGAEPVGSGCCAETDAEEGDEEEEGGKSRAAKRVTLGAMICSKGFCTNLEPGIPSAGDDDDGEADASVGGGEEGVEGVEGLPPAVVNGTMPESSCRSTCRG